MNAVAPGGALEVVRLTHERRPALVRFLGDLEERGDSAFFSPHRTDESSMRQMIDASRRDLYYVVVEGEKVLAYGLLRGWDEGYAIPSLGIAVHASVRRTGIAKLLMDFLHIAAARAGAEKVRLRVRTDNAQAISLYESLGYVMAPDKDAPEYLVGFKALAQKHAA